ncbi:MAG TPA: outer membrane beta-barrel protein [Verrucomicrobiae bacterium]|nr:outer membrane beta-barrel protein [Verrucomicrobiae bacterium]
MRSSRASGLLVAGLVLLSGAFAPAWAGITKGNGELGFDFGVTSWDQDLVGHTGSMLKLRGGYCATKWFEIEGQFAYSAHFDEGALRGNGSTDRKLDQDQAMSQVFVSGVFNFPSKSGNIIPYVLGGVGRTDVKFPNAHVDDTSSAWQAAVGSRFFYGDHDQVAFRIEAAFLFDDAFDQSNRHGQYALGFTWRLGRPRA